MTGSTPVVASGTLYVGAANGNVVAPEPGGGGEIGTAATPSDDESGSDETTAESRAPAW